MTDADVPTVLVEDEVDLADASAGWLAERWETRVACDGKTAPELFDETVDVVLLDRLAPASPATSSPGSTNEGTARRWR